jgi:hypothetical protein
VPPNPSGIIHAWQRLNQGTRRWFRHCRFCLQRLCKRVEQNDAPASFHLGHRNEADLEAVMGFGRGALLWLLGVPLPIILILALFMHH